MSQFHPTQHGGDSDFQMWQQQMMYKQLQEFQRQQQVQHLDNGARMQPSFGQFQAPAKPVPADQLSSMSNEMTDNESTPYAWSHQVHTSSDPGMASNSQMLNTGSNTNWEQYAGAPGVGNFINGSMFSSTQIQSMRPMGLVAHQMNPSLYPINTTSRDGSGNQYSQFLGIPADPRNAMTRATAQQSEKASMQFSSLMSEHGLHEVRPSHSMHNFLGKVGDNVKVGTPVPVNHLQHGVQLEDFHSRPNQVDFQVGLHEKLTMQVGSGSGGASLDPTEEKILFGNDEDGDWGALLRGGNDHGNSLDNDNLGGALPSLQSGSWSALMQEALQSTTSENSQKGEWSGLSFQKTEQVIANSSTIQGHDQNKLAALSGTNLENARPSSASSYADGTMHDPNFTSFQHAARTPYEQRDRAMPHESPNATVTNHQSTAEINNGYFQQSIKQKQSDDYGRQEQVNISNGVWTHQKSEIPRNNSPSTCSHAAPPSAHGFWMSQQNTIDHNISRESGYGQNDWKSKSPIVQDINSTPNVFSTDGNFWKSSGGNANSLHRPQQMKPDMSTMQMANNSSDGKSSSRMGSSMPTINQDQYQMVIGQTSEHVGLNHNIGRKGPEITESLGRSAEQKPNDHNQEYLNVLPTERQGHISNHGQHTSHDLASRRHSFFAGKESQNLGQSGQQAMGSYMLQNHAMDNSGINIRHSPGNPVSNQFPPQSHQTHNNLKPLFITSSQAPTNMASVNEKMLMREEQFKSRQIPNSSNAPSFVGSDAGLPQNRAVQNRQHMLQLLHKVDNSTDSNVAADMPNSSPDNIATVQKQLNQPSLQGFGLRLAPPSQRQSTAGHTWSTQTDVDGNRPEHSSKGGDHTQSSTASHSLPTGHPSSQLTPFHSSEIDSTGQPTGRFPQFGSSQQYPVSEARSGSVALPQQGSSATVFKNVWTNISAQRLGGIQSNKITPNIIQSMMFPNSTADSNLWGSQKADDQGQKASTPSDVATTSSANSQNEETKQAVDSDAGLASFEMANFDSMGATVSRGNEPIQKHSLDGNFAIPVSSLAQLHQQGIINPKQGESPAANFQAMKTSQNTGIGLHGSPTPSNIQQKNYSLLHQIQAMRHVDIDPGNTAGKRLKSTEAGSDAPQVDWKSGQRFTHGANNSARSSVDNTGNASVTGSFPSDMKMLSFTPRSNEDKSQIIPSELPSSKPLSHGMVVAAQTDQQTQVQVANASSDLIERPRINAQMAPSWFERYGSHRNGQNLSMFSLQKTPVPPYNVPKASWSMDNSAEHRIDSGQSVRPGQYISSTKMEVSVPSSTMKRRPKKRKSIESDIISWNKIIEHPQTLRNMSTIEMDWACAANRLMEKIDDDTESLEDAPINYLRCKRLSLSTRLIQQVLPAIPATVLRAQAVSACGSVTYNIAMLTLGDACSMASYNSCALTDHENNSSEQTNAKKMQDRLSKVAEVFVGRIRKMENDFVSVNKRASMLDVQLECQDLERISIVNRLGRFHGRNHAAGVEASLASEMIPRRIFPERHVMSFAVPGNLPEGVYCLSL